MFRQLWERWTRVAHTIGVFQSRVALSLFYFLILAPFGIGVRLFSDPLRLTRQMTSHWDRKERVRAPIGDGAKRQF